MREFEKNLPLTVGQWIGTFVLLLIPLVNIIMVFIWAFGNGKVGRKNFALAAIIMGVILVVTFVVVWWFVDLSFFGFSNSIKPLSFKF